MSPTQSKSQWDSLFPEACRLIDHVNRDAPIIDRWTFGGGTALMLQIQHRESHDVDLFVEDPQLLPFIKAAVESPEFGFQIGAPTYSGDGVHHLRLEFDGIGEIDFIVAAEITDQPAHEHDVGGRAAMLETPAEIVGKKVRYRGSTIQPRDIFDIAASLESGHGGAIASALSSIPDHKKATAARLAKLGDDYVEETISELMIRPQYEHLKKDSLPIVRRFFGLL